jgi:hypothetical protein
VEIGDEAPPSIALGAEHTKNGRTAVQPIPADVAGVLQGYLSGKPNARPVWPGGWADNAAEMLRIDQDAAGILYAVDAPDGPLFADFHALRHSFVAMLDKSGATLKEAMQLARHSDPKLTMARYGRAQIHDLAGTVERMPVLLTDTSPETNVQHLQATGTDPAVAQAVPFSCSSVAQTIDPREDSLIMIEHPSMGDEEGGHNQKPCVLQEVESHCDSVRLIEESSPSRTRTYNKPVNRRADLPTEKYQKHRRFKGFTAFASRLQVQSYTSVKLRENTVLPKPIR